MHQNGIVARSTRVLMVALCCPAALTVTLALSGCNEVSNNPHPLGSEKTNTLFAPFRERSPKYLDPTSSYSNDETPYTYQIYEPLYGYHYLKRPYELSAARRSEMPRRATSTRTAGAARRRAGRADRRDGVRHQDQARHPVRAAPGLRQDAKGEYVYHKLKREDVADKYQITDFADRHARADRGRLCLLDPPPGHAAHQVAVVLARWPTTSSA